MSISQSGYGNSYQESIIGSCSFDVISSGVTAVIAISYLPNNSQEILAVRINSEDCLSAGTASQDVSIATSVWYKTNLAVGQNNVEVQFDGEAKHLISYLLYEGVDQNSPVYKVTGAAGKQLTLLPFKSFSKTSGLAIGFGSVNNEISHIENIFGNQFIVYSTVSSGNGISSEAIAAYGLFNRDSISVPNALNHPADWSIVVVGLEAQ
jgi:hypothetical protein